MNEETVCKNCEHLMQPTDFYICGITCGNLDKISERPKWCPLYRNCHEYCRYGKYCRYEKGCNGMNPDDCYMSYKLEDLMNDARDIELEQRKSLDDYDYWE